MPLQRIGNIRIFTCPARLFSGELRKIFCFPGGAVYDGTTDSLVESCCECPFQCGAKRYFADAHLTEFACLFLHCDLDGLQESLPFHGASGEFGDRNPPAVQSTNHFRSPPPRGTKKLTMSLKSVGFCSLSYWHESAWGIRNFVSDIASLWSPALHRQVDPSASQSTVQSIGQQQ